MSIGEFYYVDKCEACGRKAPDGCAWINKYCPDCCKPHDTYENKPKVSREWIWNRPIPLSHEEMADLLIEAGVKIEEQPGRYRCLHCGQEFEEKRFSHGRAVPDKNGNPIEVQCGPIEEVEGDKPCMRE